MKQKPFHVIRCAGIQFTQDEWSEYCRVTRNDKSNLIYTTFGKYIFNDHDICLNPDRVAISAKDGSFGYNIEIMYAWCGNGLWSFGIHYNLGTGGGGFGVSWVSKPFDPTEKKKYWDRGFQSERECLIAASLYVLDKLHGYNGGDGKMVSRLRQKVEEYKKGIERPKVVQLELF